MSARKPSDGSQACASDKPELKVVNIRQARQSLPQIVNSVASGSSSGVLIGPRGVPTAAIVAHELAATLLNPGNKRRKLAVLVVEELLGDAPPHLKRPAVDELSRLPMSDLTILWDIERLPLSERQRASVEKRLEQPEAFARLLLRHEVADAICRAKAAGLYDMLEDAANEAVGGDAGAPD